MTITPTVGRIVHYYPPGKWPPSTQPLAAIIAHVWSDTCVNLMIFDANGNVYKQPQPTSVLLVQADNEVPSGGGYCCWPPKV